MSTISDYVRMEQRDLEIGELAEVSYGDVGEVLSFHDETSYDLAIDGDKLMIALMDDVRPASHGPFAVTTIDADGGEETRYFRTLLAAQVFAGRTDDEVVGVEGLMA